LIKNKQILGNKKSIETRTRSLAKNGNTPIKVSEMGTFLAILLIINTLSPIRGVIKPTYNDILNEIINTKI